MSKDAKKKLLVKTEEPLNNLAEAEAEPEPLSIPPKKANDKRGKGEHVMGNLEKGREKLQIIWAEKRKEKEALAEKALQKKMNLKEKQKKKIMEEYGVDSLSTDDEVEAPPVVVKKAPKVVAPPPVVVKAPKKKIVRYVEEEESSEEEIVYVKREKKDRYVAPQEPPRPTLIFY